MPVSVRRDPFEGERPRPAAGRSRAGRAPRKVGDLRPSHANVLAVLMPPPEHLGDPTLWPLWCRTQLVARVRKADGGQYAQMTRILNGIKPGAAGGEEPHPGMVELGLVEEVILDIEGAREYHYQITAKGIAAYQKHLERGVDIPTGGG